MTCASGLTSRTFWKHSGVDESGGEKEEGQKRLSPDYLSNTPPLPITPFHFPQPPVTFVIQDVGMTLRHSIWSTKATKASQTMKNCGFARFTRDLCFAAVLVLTTTWNDLFCSCVDNVITLRQLFTFFYLSPNRSHEFTPRKVRAHFTSHKTWNNREVIERRWSYIFRGGSRRRCRCACLTSLHSVLPWRHGGHVGVQNNKEKSILGILCHFYAKLERHFTIALYTNMAFSSREWKPRIDFVIEPCTYFLTLKTVP